MMYQQRQKPKAFTLGYRSYLASKTACEILVGLWQHARNTFLSFYPGAPRVGLWQHTCASLT
jgi:hypothetical protein